MTPKEMTGRIWCDVYARVFVRLTRADGIYQGYNPSEASKEAGRLADAAVAEMDFGACAKTANGTGIRRNP
jgi:hypothetical protein